MRFPSVLIRVQPHTTTNGAEIDETNFAA